MKMRMTTALAMTAAATAGVVALAQSETPVSMGDIERAWIENTTPGAHHERLHYFVGDWEAEMSYRMQPGAPVTDGAFESTYEMIMDGRYLEERISSDSEMGPFRGRGVIGYDNTKQRYVSSWIDNMSTTIYSAEGFWDEGATTLEFQGRGPDMTGEWKDVRYVLTRESHDAFMMREWVYEDDGTRWQRFEARYSRED